MNYNEFVDDLSKYYTLYEKGLKKQANEYLENYTNELRALEKDVFNNIFFCLAKKLCDEKELQFIKERGNGRIPYALDVLLRDYLYEECLDGKMPQLRWFYELYYNNELELEYAFDMLEKAYASEYCDNKTVELLFESYINILEWGAHHFPEGCIISKECMENAIRQCKKIINEKQVGEHQKTELSYYEILYDCYYKYLNDGKIKDFQAYFNESNISDVYKFVIKSTNPSPFKALTENELLDKLEKSREQEIQGMYKDASEVSHNMREKYDFKFSSD